MRSLNLHPSKFQPTTIRDLRLLKKSVSLKSFTLMRKLERINNSWSKRERRKLSKKNKPQRLIKKLKLREKKK